MLLRVDVAQVIAPVSPSSRAHVVVAACAGNLLEWYDFAVYGALASVLAQVFFGSSGDESNLLAVFGVYATAFVMRPLGALLFGHLGDRRSRRDALAASIALMTLASAGVGLLPGYATIGLLAPLLLILLRATQGIAAGGEIGVSAVFLAERAPGRARGATCAWHTATMSLGTAIAVAVGAGLTAGLAHDRLADSWWRVAFLAAVPLGLVAVYLRRSARAVEPVLVQDRSGLSQVWRSNRRAVAIGFVHVSAPIVCFNLFFIYLPARVSADHTVPLAPALACALAGLVTVAVVSLAAGALSDQFGRRRIVVPASATLAMLSVPLVLLATSGSWVGLAVAEVVAGALVGGSLSVALLTELFPREARARALGMTAGIASALVGGMTPIVAQAASMTTGSMMVPGAYLAAVAAAAAIAVATTEETAFGRLD